MRRRPFAEWLLAAYAGAQRGASIYGDLEEIGATRGRAWFWREYLSVMIRLLITARVWANGVSAFIWAYLLVRWHVGTVVFSWTRREFRTRGQPTEWFYTAWRYVPFHTDFFLLLMNSLFFMAFLLPFVLIRYGIRDRVSRLTCAMCLLTMPFSSGWPGPALLSLVVTAIMFIAALCARQWRRPALVVLLSLAAGIPALRIQYRLIPHHLLRSLVESGFAFRIAYAVIALVCLYLHRRLIERRPIFTFPPRAKRVCVG